MTASYKACISHIQCPSSFIILLGKRAISSVVSFPPSRTPRMPRPLVAPMSIARNFRILYKDTKKIITYLCKYDRSKQR